MSCRCTSCTKQNSRPFAVFLHFDPRLTVRETFRATWEQTLPGLKDLYELEADGLTLRLKAEHQPNDYEGLCELCEKTMLNRLVYGNTPLWYLLRRKDGEQELPRAGYYFASLFILGSLARYQPELLHTSLPPGSEMEWFFNRFIQNAERFFPQLMYSFGHKRQVYFTRH